MVGPFWSCLLECTVVSFRMLLKHAETFLDQFSIKAAARLGNQQMVKVVKHILDMGNLMKIHDKK